MRRSQGANPVTEQSVSLHPVGQPISVSRKRGLQVRGRAEATRPKLKIIRSRRESGGAPLRTRAGRRPRLRVSNQSSVHDTAAVSIPAWKVALAKWNPVPSSTSAG